MNRSPCGHLGGPGCRFTEDQMIHYRSKISGPLLCRIDLRPEVPELPLCALANAPPGEVGNTGRGDLFAPIDGEG